MGGEARFFGVAKTAEDLLTALDFAKKKRLPWYVVGEGSNLIVPDRGYPGVVIQNQIQRFDLSSTPVLPKRTRVTVGAGNNLFQFVFKLGRMGLDGMEKMAGIPGTVGGAIYGCAGAYGQEIKDRLLSVTYFDGKEFKNLTRKQARFGYRESIFKRHNNWVVTEAVFEFEAEGKPGLLRESREIVRLRSRKYKPGLKCPGSFFKNIKIDDIKSPRARNAFLKLIPTSKVIHGKVPTGYLLEEVGAKKMKQGGVRVAAHHGNLIYNIGRGRARDVRALASRLKALVKNKFGITIEEEVRYLE